RLKNWWYTGVSPNPIAAAAFGAVSFATVLPAVRLGLAVLRAPELPPRRSSRPGLLLATGGAMLGLALAAPRYAFPLAWLFLWPLCEGLLALMPPGAEVRSPMRHLLALALPLGLTWESLNWGAARGWVYTVPFF